MFFIAYVKFLISKRPFSEGTDFNQYTLSTETLLFYPKDIDFLTPDKIKRDKWREDALKDERKNSHNYYILKEDLLRELL